MRRLFDKYIFPFERENRRLTGELDALRLENDYLRTMVKEAYHRTKNYLSVLMSALSMQGRSCSDTKTENAVKEASSMVMTVLTLNEMFSINENLKHVSAQPYLTRLARRVFALYGGGKLGLHLHLNVQDISLPADMLLPCGMIMNELIVNALKHAFPEGKGGTITASFVRQGDKNVSLCVKDDGVGVEYLEKDTLGLRLVRVLSVQLGGSIKVENRAGAECEVVFKV